MMVQYPPPTTDKRYCPSDGHEMARDVRPMTIAYKGRETTFAMPGWYCGACGEGVHAGADMKLSDRGLNKLRAAVEGVLAPGEVRRIRKKLGLSQADAGTIIGGGPRAFQKHESAEIVTSRAVSTALRLLDRHPEDVQYLREYA